MSGTKLPISSQSKKPSEAELQAQAEQQLDRLVNEVRLLEGYYQEVTVREQSASNALTETRSAIEAIDGLSENPKSEVLLPIGAGILLPLKDVETRKYIVSVGAGIAIEKDVVAVRNFLDERQKEVQSAVTGLAQQRREIGSRLEAGKSALRQITGQDNI